MTKLKDSFKSDVEIEREQVKALEDELSIVKACESKLDEDLHASMEEVHDLESQIKNFEGKVTKKEDYIILLKNRYS